MHMYICDVLQYNSQRTSIETILVPNKKADSFMKKLPAELHGFIKEAEPEKRKKVFDIVI